MPTLDELLADDEADAPQPSMDDLLADDEPTRTATAARGTATAVNKAELPWYTRAAQGVADPVVGAGQLMQNIVPDAAMNVARHVPLIRTHCT